MSALLCPFLLASAATAQAPDPADPIIGRIWSKAMEDSQFHPLAHTLFDRIGPRLTGSPEQAEANAWMAGMYASWGIPARQERYGTWNGWYSKT